ncbi:MAG: hypothetical protein L6R39_006457 [Caloplaca ligustica]|nr:MAG: hypothetical protein L6R39_006457 [Caloplaca ligustica]
MNELSMRFCMSPPTGRTIVALNRKLDEVENILSISSHGDNENPRLHDRALAEVEKSSVQAKEAEAQNKILINDLMDDEAELKYLRLKLRILEIQTLPYVPSDDHDGLAAGIRRWKADWAEVHRRQRRRWKERGLDQQLGSYL